MWFKERSLGHCPGFLASVGPFGACLRPSWSSGTRWTGSGCSAAGRGRVLPVPDSDLGLPFQGSEPTSGLCVQRIASCLGLAVLVQSTGCEGQRKGPHLSFWKGSFCCGDSYFKENCEKSFNSCPCYWVA